ncbi:DUF1543 domain-containing protein [Acerihabitans sp. KWT182]|uniref:DUF1543 domain-containing protein n=1 Tax=Acerihabitans sp. KWT182 TaxID=3157919 RepID=A0AAU7Q8V5_9GAMM
MNLYMFYLGGNAGKSNIEVHDIQFAAADTPEQAWPLLREAWFGDKDKIHLDGYMIINWADGYDVTLSREPSQNRRKLFFVNAGGYRPDTLAELHEFDLFVATDAEAAKSRALETLLTGVDQQHKDNLKDVDDCLLLDKIGDYYLHLRENPQGEKPSPAWQGYQPIGE